MGLLAVVQNKVTRTLFSPERRDKSRRKAEHARRLSGTPHVVEYFHDASDPYSHLMAQILPDFCQRYKVELNVHITAPPPDWAAPDRGRLESYARIDAERLARRAGLIFTDLGHQPSATELEVANHALLVALDKDAFLMSAAEIGQRLWAGRIDALEASTDPDATTRLADAAALRDELGHYLGATLYYAGEWYWGLDRLHHLERRLQALDAMKADTGRALIYAPADAPTGRAASPPERKPDLHWYLSFRSPYTAIVGARVKALADAYGAALKLRYVLPMVMRGMKVPRKKSFYIMSDVVREAERQAIPFGNLVDPVGAPVERGYAILEAAIQQGRGFEFAQSFLSGVWAEGINAGSDRGLKIITERAGLSWADMKPQLSSESWRAVAEANRQDMFKYDLWGVPSFRVDAVASWGQDRLWVIEDALKSNLDG
ncbi:MAG: DsbA family protein [Pseudomonadota bacterium]